MPSDSTGCHWRPNMSTYVTHIVRYVQRRDPDRAVKPQPLELPRRQDGGHMRRLAVLTANHRYVWRLQLRKLLFFHQGHFWSFRLSHGQPWGPSCPRPTVYEKYEKYETGPKMVIIIRLDALAKALSVIATATWLGGWLGGWVAGWVAGCPSHSGIVSKGLNVSENFFYHLKAPSF